MPELNWSDVLAILTPETVVPCFIAGIGLGIFLWRTSSRRVLGIYIFRGWIIGIAFLAVMASGRWVKGSEHWEAWIGTSFLWTLYVLGGYVVVVGYRYSLRYMRQDR